MPSRKRQSRTPSVCNRLKPFSIEHFKFFIVLTSVTEFIDKLLVNEKYSKLFGRKEHTGIPVSSLITPVTTAKSIPAPSHPKVSGIMR